jgi:PadR family transcriptional regulator
MVTRSAMDKHLLRGAATTVLLLILRDTPSYGYELVQEIRRRSGEQFDFGEGTIYPLLYSLEEDGAIKGEWAPGVGERRRRVYRLTAKGRKELARRLAAWDRYEKGMKLALRGALSGATAAPAAPHRRGSA